MAEAELLNIYVCCVDILSEVIEGCFLFFLHQEIETEYIFF